MCRTGRVIPQLLRCAIVGLVCLACGAAQGAASATVHSYKGQFAVTAPDVEYASEIAQLCEQIRDEVQRRLGASGLWKGRASVLIMRRTVEGETGPETVWDVEVSRGGAVQMQRGLLYGQVEDFLRLAVCAHVVRQIALDSAAAHDGSLRGRPIPFWLYAGLAELIVEEQRLDLFLNTAKAIKDKRSYVLEDLFEHPGRFESGDQRAIFCQQAGTVVHFLLNVKRGRDRLCLSLEDLWRKSSYMLSLRWEYRDLFASLEPMAAAWEAYVHERPSRMLSEQRLTLAETEALLQLVLKVDIPVIAEDTIEQSIVETDFAGLSEHENRRVVDRICREKAEQLLQLSLRSAQEFKPALEAYALALNAIRDRKGGRFRKYLKLAEREHEAVRRLPYFTEGGED